VGQRRVEQISEVILNSLDILSYLFTIQ